MTLDEMKDMLAKLMQDSSELSRKYQGVRPSWVSTDLAILGQRINGLRMQIKHEEQNE